MGFTDNNRAGFAAFEEVANAPTFDEEPSQGFGWDDEIEESSGSKFEPVPDGDYWFTVTGFERGWYEARPGSKLASCNQAELQFTIDWQNDAGEWRKNKIAYKLKLSRKLQWLIYEFFESIGLRKKGDGTTKMPWNDVIGKTGICEVSHHVSDRGGIFNDINKCYPPEEAPRVVKNTRP